MLELRQTVPSYTNKNVGGPTCKYIEPVARLLVISGKFVELE